MVYNIIWKFTQFNFKISDKYHINWIKEVAFLFSSLLLCSSVFAVMHLWQVSAISEAEPLSNFCIVNFGLV